MFFRIKLWYICICYINIKFSYVYIYQALFFLIWACLKMRCPFLVSKLLLSREKRTPHFDTFPYWYLCFFDLGLKILTYISDSLITLFHYCMNKENIHFTRTYYHRKISASPTRLELLSSVQMGMSQNEVPFLLVQKLPQI